MQDPPPLWWLRDVVGSSLIIRADDREPDAIEIRLSCGHAIWRLILTVPDAMPCRHCWAAQDRNIQRYYGVKL